MEINNTSDNQSRVYINNSPFSYYGYAWGKLWKYFLELLLVTIISFLVEFPTIGFTGENLDFFDKNFFSIDLFIISFQGVGAFILFSVVLYIFFILPLEYGLSYIHLLVARGSKFKVKDMFKVFDNYWNAVFANLLVHTIVGLGIVVLIIPGIVFACKLSFVSYLIVDKKMDVVEAVKQSWEMTNGYSWSIFFVGILTMFVFILGALVFGVGAVIAIMWIRVTFAAIFFAADNKLEARKELL